MAALLKPRAVAAGGRVAVVSPASYADAARLDAGLAGLRALGYDARLAANANQAGPLFFAGDAKARLADLHGAFADANVECVATVRGGYGSSTLLDRLDLDLIRANAKPLLGYSDLTALQLYLLDAIGLPAFHGPLVAGDFDRVNGVHLASLLASLAGELYSVGAAEGLRMLRGDGCARGTLYGGCLSIITAMMGTPYEPKTEGKMLFLEDVGERPYRVHRMLWQLRAAGKLDGVCGIIFGEMKGCGEANRPELLSEAILDALGDFAGPVAIGLHSGHVSGPCVTLTFGVEAELNAEANAPTLTMLEAAVSA